MVRIDLGAEMPGETVACWNLDGAKETSPDFRPTKMLAPRALAPRFLGGGALDSVLPFALHSCRH